MNLASKAMKRLPEGTVLGERYEITGFLGEGGFALVYKGRDTAIKRQIAIKILNIHATTSDPEVRDNMLARFRREAETAAQIRHPNAVTIFDVGMTEDHYPFIVMEMLVGRGLDEILVKDGGLKPARAVKLFVRCLEALGEAHRLKIVHKDLKPSNLFLTDPGTDHESLAILDFGIAGMAEEGDARLTGTGQLLGTPRYMAPEYIEHQQLSAAVDVYQMGLILLEMFSGRPVVDKDSLVSCIMVHTTKGIEIPPNLLGTPLGPIVARAIAKDPQKRYPDADAFRKALETCDMSLVEAIIDGTVPPGTRSWEEHHKANAPKEPETKPEPPVKTNDEADKATRKDLESVQKDKTVIETTPPEPPAKKPNKLMPLMLVAGVIGVLLIIGVVVLAFIIPGVIGGDDPKPKKGKTAKATKTPKEDLDKGKPSKVAAKADPKPDTDKPKKDPQDPPKTDNNAAPEPKADNANPWIAIKAPSEALKLGVDPQKSGLKGKELKNLNAFVVDTGIVAPTDAFKLQQHEVTWAELDPWLADNAEHAFARPEGTPEGAEDRKNLPATGIPWTTAQAYCKSIGGALPTEEQWEYAARGQALQPFPWGDDPSALGKLNAFKGKKAKLAPVGTSEVDKTGSEPALVDMMGNAQEWTASDWRGNMPGADVSWAFEGDIRYHPIRGYPLERTFNKRSTRAVEGASYRMSLCSQGPCVEKSAAARRFVGFRCAKK